METMKLRGTLLILGLDSQQHTVAGLQFSIETGFPTDIITSRQRKMLENIFAFKISQ